MPARQFQAQEADVMRAITGVRLGVTLFVALIIVAAAAGWVWTGQHQPPAAAIASRLVLGLGGLFSVVALITIWRPHPRR
jgi:hypothetical protein